MNKLRAFFILSLSIVVAFSANAYSLTAEQIYKYAKLKDHNALVQVRDYLEIQDSKGNTALCLAVKDDNYEAYSLLKQYGANTQPYCLRAALNSGGGTFLGMGKTGWLTTGAIVAAGVGAAAAGGGGGGGGGGGSSSSNTPSSGGNDTSTIVCINGVISGGTCVCKTGYTGANCDQLDKNHIIGTDDNIYEKLNCQNGGVQVNDACSCPEGWEGNLCQSRKQEAQATLTDYDIGRSIIGDEVIEDDVKRYEVSNNEDVKVVRETEDTVAGLLVKGEHITNTRTSSGEQTNTVDVEQRGSGDVYGILAYRHDEQETDGDAYRVDVENASAGNNGTSSSYINIDNKGDDNAYGISINTNDDENVESYVTNADAHADTKEASNLIYIAKSKGVINITNGSNGDVYGIIGTYANNAYAASYADDDKVARSEALGIIRIANSGDGNVYAMSTRENGVLENANVEADSTGKAKATGVIHLINAGKGNMYGMYAPNASAYNRNDANRTSIIELANISSGLVVGMYAKNGTIENSGDIKIHNLADGLAVGMYADGTTAAINSGNITIDRSDFVDDMATEYTSDDVTYRAISPEGGMAIGIYGAKDSSITNIGTIKISGADTAYGIYSEGSDVTNMGTILIDGGHVENAIVLNGSSLFQDGVIIVKSVLDCRNGGVQVNDACVCASGYIGDLCENIDDNHIIGEDGNLHEKLDCNHGHQVNDACVCDSGYAGIACNQVETCPHGILVDDVCVCNEGYYLIGGACQRVGLYGSLNNSSIVIENNDDVDVYGIYNNGSVINAQKSEVGTIDITNNGDGNVYGIYGVSESNASISSATYDYPDSEANGTINIANIGNGSVYGMYASGGVTNAHIHIKGDNVHSTANGIINIVNTGDGDVYGLYGHSVRNAYIETDNDSFGTNSHNTAVGIIKIDNNGNGNVYGIYDDESDSIIISANAYTEINTVGTNSITK